MEVKQYNLKDEGGIPADIKMTEGFYELHYSQHAKQRFLERAGNDPVFPHILNIIRDKNVVGVKVDDGGKVATEIVVRLQYTRYTRIFLVIVPYDNATALVKTLWFREKKIRKRKSNYEKSQIIPAPGAGVIFPLLSSSEKKQAL